MLFGLLASVSLILVKYLRQKTVFVHINNLPRTPAKKKKKKTYCKWPETGCYVTGDGSFQGSYSFFSRCLRAPCSCSVGDASSNYPAFLPTAMLSFRKFQHLASALIFLIETACNLSKSLYLQEKLQWDFLNSSNPSVILHFQKLLIYDIMGKVK